TTAAIGQPLARLWRVLSLRSGRVHMVPLALRTHGPYGHSPARSRRQDRRAPRPPRHATPFRGVALAPLWPVWLGVDANPAKQDGGRTRTRTLDPLIKSLLCSIEIASVFSQPCEKAGLSKQFVRRIFPTV